MKRLSISEVTTILEQIKDGYISIPIDDGA